MARKEFHGKSERRRQRRSNAYMVDGCVMCVASHRILQHYQDKVCACSKDLQNQIISTKDDFGRYDLVKISVNSNDGLLRRSTI